MEVIRSTINYVLVCSVVIFVTSCYNSSTTANSNNSNFGGDLSGILNRASFTQDVPYGMVLVPGGGFNMGQSDQNISFAHNNRVKTVSISDFMMDQTEITNNEYRQFVNYVKDSLFRMFAIENDLVERETYMKTIDEYGVEIEDEELHTINWSIPFDWKNPEIIDEDGRIEFKENFYLSRRERFSNAAQIDVRKLNFVYWWINFEAAKSRETRLENAINSVNKLGHDNPILAHADREPFMIREYINIYPDTLVWIADFTYSYNEPLTENYFWHPAYDNYPVVGVTWKQAIAFCYWRTVTKKNFLSEENVPFHDKFRLPSEAEWEYAARGGYDGVQYPWGGPYIRNSKGCFLGNFKPMRGRYKEDGGIHTVEGDSYHPNLYGLYNMAGNVAEWTNSVYDPSIYEFQHDLDPNITYDALATDAPVMKRKVIRGGSWKDIGYYIQNGTRTYEYQDTSKSYIGFRCVQSYLGRASI